MTPWLLGVKATAWLSVVGSQFSDGRARSEHGHASSIKWCGPSREHGAPIVKTEDREPTTRWLTSLLRNHGTAGDASGEGVGGAVGGGEGGGGAF